MLTLAVDTSTRTGSLALLKGGSLLCHAVVSAGEPYSNGFSPTVEGLLREAGLLLSQLDLFAVAAGPGSFTGLRIGLAAVKAWAEVFERPIAAVSVLEAISMQALQGPSLRPEGFLAPFFDARRGQVFGGLYWYSPAEAERVYLAGEEFVASPEEFLQTVAGQSKGAVPILASPTPDVMVTALAASPKSAAEVRNVSPVLAPMIGLLGYRQALRGQTVDALALDASYVRRTDAELKWKE